MGSSVVKPSGKGHNKPFKFKQRPYHWTIPLYFNSQCKVLTSFDKLQYDSLAKKKKKS
jgi:hypothetical protein